MGRRLLLLLGLAAACAAPTASPAPAATLRVVTTDLAQPLLSDLVSAYAEVAPRVTFATSVGSPAGLAADLAEGRADFGLGVARPPDLFATPVAYLPLAIVVHPTNLVQRLTLAQVREVFAGRVTDWAQVGGRSAGVQVVSREPSADAEAAFASSVLVDGGSVTLAALVAPSWEAMREAVSQDPGAIGYLPVPELDARVKLLSVDAEVRALVVALAAGEPAGAARDFLAWAQSAAGQSVVAHRYLRVAP